MTDLTQLFPLYFELAKEAHNKKASWSWINARLGTLEKAHNEVLYLLILTHYLIFKGKSTNVEILSKSVLKSSSISSSTRKIIPFTAKIYDGNKGALFQVQHLPEELLAIIAEYLSRLYREKGE